LNTLLVLGDHRQVSLQGSTMKYKWRFIDQMFRLR